MLLAFCKSIVADAEAREIVIETDLTGLAQNKTLAGLPAGSSDSNLRESNPLSNLLSGAGLTGYCRTSAAVG